MPATAALMQFQSKSFDASCLKRHESRRRTRGLKRCYQSLEQTDAIQQQQQKKQQRKRKSKFTLGGDDDHEDENDDDDDSAAAADDGSDDANDETDNAGNKNRIGGWRGIRAVVAYYCSLRKIKRNGAIFDKLLLCLIVTNHFSNKTKKVLTKNNENLTQE